LLIKESKLNYRSFQIGHEDDEKRNIANDEEESQQGDHVWGEPHGQQFDKAIPLFGENMPLFSLVKLDIWAFWLRT